MIFGLMLALTARSADVIRSAQPDVKQERRRMDPTGIRPRPDGLGMSQSEPSLSAGSGFQALAAIRDQGSDFVFLPDQNYFQVHSG